MAKTNLAYKYLALNSHLFALLINKELYFSSPEKLNDPFDCQFNLLAALDAAGVAISKLPGGMKHSVTERLTLLGGLESVFEKMENDWLKIGVLSLSKCLNNPLMWTHYAHDHKGLCLEFELREPFIGVNVKNQIIGLTSVRYHKKNPFLAYFEEVASTGNISGWDEFWVEMLSIGMASKTRAWLREKEIRVLRKMPGTVPFEFEMLRSVIFGNRMIDKDRMTIRNLLSGTDWEHINYFEMEKSEADLSFKPIKLKD